MLCVAVSTVAGIASQLSLLGIQLPSGVDPWNPSVASQSIAPTVCSISLFPYLGFLYHLTKSNTAPRITLGGFYFLLVFVGATSECMISHNHIAREREMINGSTCPYFFPVVTQRYHARAMTAPIHFCVFVLIPDPLCCMLFLARGCSCSIYPSVPAGIYGKSLPIVAAT